MTAKNIERAAWARVEEARARVEKIAPHGDFERNLIMLREIASGGLLDARGLAALAAYDAACVKWAETLAGVYPAR
jgi:hypothetical protein